jgi:hypothetical protein
MLIPFAIVIFIGAATQIRDDRRRVRNDRNALNSGKKQDTILALRDMLDREYAYSEMESVWKEMHEEGLI